MNRAQPELVLLSRLKARRAYFFGGHADATEFE